MNHRKTLYGYQYRMGELIINDGEAVTVRRIVTLYLDGLSYQKIADALNDHGIPFSDEDASWNKHKIKRLLENPRYAGEDGYQPIINHEQFRAVQAKIQSKQENRDIPSRPVLRLRQLLICAECGGNLRVTAGVSVGADRIRLNCKKCKIQIDLPDAELINAIISQTAKKKDQGLDNIWRPSAEVIRLENAVQRSMENPAHPEETVSLILRGVSARYDCCPNPNEANRRDAVTETDRKHPDRLIHHITVSKNNAINIYFQPT